MGFILVLIVVICIYALVRISRRNKELDDTGVHVTDAPSYEPSPQPKAETPEPSSQNTIYAYSAKSTTHICPFCDGENAAGADSCIICGQHLN